MAIVYEIKIGGEKLKSLEQVLEFCTKLRDRLIVALRYYINSLWELLKDLGTNVGERPFFYLHRTGNHLSAA